MSISRPAARSLVSRLATVGAAAPRTSSSSRLLPVTAATAAAAPSPCRTFHSSAPLAKRRRSRFSSVRAAEMGLVTPDDVTKFTEQKFPEYTAEEKAVLRQRYTPEQMAALEAGEAAIDPRDLTIQGRLRNDVERPRYIDDFSKMDRHFDRTPRTATPADAVKLKWKTPDEFMEGLDGAFSEVGGGGGGGGGPGAGVVGVGEQLLGEGATPEQVDKALDRELAKMLSANERGEPVSEEEIMARLDKFLGDDASTLAGVKSTGNFRFAAPLPPQITGVTEHYRKDLDAADNELDPEGTYKEIKMLTGYSIRDILSMHYKTLVSRFVVNQTRLGKIGSWDVMAVAGDKNGRIGLGVGRSVDLSVAATKARLAAIRNMQPIPRYEDRTIYGNVRAKISGTVVELFSRPPGFGLRVPHRIFEICRAAGIQDLAARIPRSRNPMNGVKATFQALLNQPNPEDIAIGRGKKLVDVRKVYYGGAVY